MSDTDILENNNHSIDVVDDDKKIDAAVDFINETANKTIYQGSIEIGNYILKHFFENDINLATSKNPKKQASFRKLCERDDLTIHPSRLGLMVRVASQERFILEENVDPGQLSYTQKASLVKLENNPEKISLIQQCIDGEWTTRQLDDRISELVQLDSPASKTSLVRTASKFIKKMDDVLELDDSAFQIDDKEIGSMSKAKRQKLLKQIKDLKTKIQKSTERSAAIGKNCDELLTRLKSITKKTKMKETKPAEKVTATAPLQ